MPSLDFQIVAQTALVQGHSLLVEWLPGGRVEGKEYTAVNPTRGDRKPGSFKVNLATGAWADFATHDAKGGDLISLFGYLHNLEPKDALYRVAERVAVNPGGNGHGKACTNAGSREVPAWLPIMPIPDDAGKAEPHPRLGKPSQAWCYRDASGNRLGWVCRFDQPDGSKEVLPLVYAEGPDGQRAWRWQGFPVPRPLYGLDRLAARPDAVALVVEGEKAADAAQARFSDLVAITSPSGSKAAAKADWSPLQGCRVVVCPDADEPGAAYALEVARLTHRAGAASVRVMQLPDDFPKKWDLADPLPPGWPPERLQGLLDNAPAWEPQEPPKAEGPRPLRRKLPDPQPYPIEALGAILAPAAQEIADTVQAPPAIAGQSVLSAAGLAVQAHGDVLIDGRQFPTSINAVSVGGSGERKTGVDDVTLVPIRERERAQAEIHRREWPRYLLEREAWEAEKRRIMKPSNKPYQERLDELKALPEPEPPLTPILLVGDPTLEGLQRLFAGGQPSLGIFSDEGGRLVGGHALNQENVRKTGAGLSSLWNGRPLDRVRSAEEASKLFGKRLSVHLMMQPGVALDLVSNEVLSDQGLISRFLLTWPTSTVGTRKYCAVDPHKLPGIRAYHRRLAEILERPYPLVPETRNELDPPCLIMSSEAKALWVRFHDEVEVSQGEGTLATLATLATRPPESKKLDLSPIKAFASKAAEHAARLAAVLQLVQDLDSRQIDGHHMALGIKLAQYYIFEALRLHHAGVSHPDLAAAETLLAWLRKRPTPLVSLPDIYQLGPNSIRDQATAKRLVKILVEHGWLEPTGPTEVDGVPRREAWRLVGGAS
jgi:hypothetical protein